MDNNQVGALEADIFSEDSPTQTLSNSRVNQELLSFNKKVLIFFAYAFFFFFWETFYHYFQHDELVKRGFLMGLYCPIYGFSALAVLFILNPFKKNIPLMFFFSALFITVLEYVTSVVLQVVFHTTWWDYHDMPFNIDGRVALPVSLFWGLLCVLALKYAHPKVMRLITYLEGRFGNVLCAIILFVMISDFLITLLRTLVF